MFAKPILVCLLTTLAAAGGGPVHIDGPAKKPFVVHEWGTFLAVQGSDGGTLGGMVDSDEVLPAFVEANGQASYRRVNMTCKMETPVTYFYTDTPRTVQVRIEMPDGLLTHWYPLAKGFGQIPASGPNNPARGFLEWKNVQLLPSTTADRLVSPVSDNLNWRFARETDAALLKVTAFLWNEPTSRGSKADQYEKFLFYRGLGALHLPLEVQTSELANGALSLKLTNQSVHVLAGLFAVKVENQTIRFVPLGVLDSHATQEYPLSQLLGKSQSFSEGVPLVKHAVAKSLMEAGLYEKEAQAMVNTWERSYFKTDGIRVLYLLPRSQTDAIIPIRIQPIPDQLERVMVGRVEVLTPQRERQIEKFISQLGAADFRARQEASDGLAGLGRISEPALRRVAKTTQDPEVRARAAQLIQQYASR